MSVDAVARGVATSSKRWRGESVHFEERLSALDRRPPRGEIESKAAAVAVFVRVLELVERAVLGVEQCSVSAEEVIIDRNAVH